MNKQLKQPFLLLSIIFFLISIPLLLFNKDMLNLFFANHSTTYLSYFFFIFTKLGEGIFIAIVVIFILIRNIGKATYILISIISSSIICQIIKHALNIPRPKNYIENFEVLSQYCFWEIYSSLSFPSGHTTAAFALFCSLSLIINNKAISILCFIAALGVGISRIYLLQHFFIDIYVGAALGIVVSTVFFNLIYPKFAGKSWAELSLLTWIKLRA